MKMKIIKIGETFYKKILLGNKQCLAKVVL